MGFRTPMNVLESVPSDRALNGLEDLSSKKSVNQTCGSSASQMRYFGGRGAPLSETAASFGGRRDAACVCVRVK